MTSLWRMAWCRCVTLLGVLVGRCRSLAGLHHSVLALRDALEAELVLLEEIFSLVSGKLAKLLTFVESVGLCVVVKA